MFCYCTGGDDRTRTVHLKEFKHSGGGCFLCQFWPNSNASHCAVIVHTLREILISSLFKRSGDSAGGCVVVEPDGQHVVAFGYVNGTLCGHPYRIFLQGTVYIHISLDCVMSLLLTHS